jgi:hypothetical protein
MPYANLTKEFKSDDFSEINKILIENAILNAKTRSERSQSAPVLKKNVNNANADKQEISNESDSTINSSENLTEKKRKNYLRSSSALFKKIEHKKEAEKTVSSISLLNMHNEEINAEKEPKQLNTSYDGSSLSLSEKISPRRSLPRKTSIGIAKEVTKNTHNSNSSSTEANVSFIENSNEEKSTTPRSTGSPRNILRRRSSSSSIEKKLVRTHSEQSHPSLSSSSEGIQIPQNTSSPEVVGRRTLARKFSNSSGLDKQSIFASQPVDEKIAVDVKIQLTVNK